MCLFRWLIVGSRFSHKDTRAGHTHLFHCSTTLFSVRSGDSDEFKLLKVVIVDIDMFCSVLSRHFTRVVNSINML